MPQPQPALPTSKIAKALVTSEIHVAVEVSPQGKVLLEEQVMPPEPISSEAPVLPEELVTLEELA